MSASDKIIRGTAFVTIANILSRIGTFLGSLIVIRLLGLEQVGMLGLLESWLSLASMFALFGLGVATTRYVATSLVEDNRLIGAYSGAAILLGLIFSVVTGVVAYFVIRLAPGPVNFDTSDLIGATRWFIMTHVLLIFSLLVTMTMREIGSAILQGLQLFQLFVYVNLTIGLLSLPVSYLLVRAYGLVGALQARLVLTSVELCLILVLVLHSMQRMETRFTLNMWQTTGRRLIAFGLPTFIGQLIANPVRTFMITLLAAQPAGAVQVGLLTTAGRIVGLANFIPASMASVIMPILATEWQRQRERFGQTIQTTLRMLWLASLPFTLLFLGATPTILSELYGSEYVAASMVTFLLLVVVLLASINETSDRTLAAANRQWLSTGNNLVWTVLFWLLGLVLVPRYLGLGYAIALLVSFGLYVALQLGWLWRLYQIPLRPLLPLTALSLSGVFFAWWIAMLTTGLLQFILSGLFALLAAVIVWYWLLSREEQNAFHRRARQARISLVGLLYRLGNVLVL